MINQRVAATVVTLCLSTLGALAQTPTATPLRQAVSRDVGRSTTITLAQIVSRQRETLQKIRSARGVAVWREEGSTTSGAPPLRLIYFAYSTTSSVNLITAWDGKSLIRREREKPDWNRVLAAYFIQGEQVYAINPREKTRRGWLTQTPYNPAVHERNPIVGFRIEQLADEPVSLADLWATHDQMAGEAKIERVADKSEEKYAITFINAQKPGEQLYYVVNATKGYLNEFIARYSNGRPLFVTTIAVGNTASGLWLPARRVKWEYGADGRLLRRSEWYFHTLDINVPLAPFELSFSYFHLPPEAVTRTIQTNAPAKENP